MKRVEKLPPAFRRFHKIGGVLIFAVFEDAGASEEEILSAVSETLGGGIDPEALRRIGSRRIGPREFFGDWYDRESGMLLRRGSHSTADGSELHDPKLVDLERSRILSSATSIPDAGTGGQFAYAFSCTPYGLRARPREIQALFEEIRDFILPPLEDSAISDWSSPLLPEVSAYFAPGMEWWGAFLFSIHIPALRRLTIVAGSTTD